MDEKIEVELEKKLLIGHESQSNCGNGNLECASEEKVEDPGLVPDTVVNHVDHHHLTLRQKEKDAGNYLSPGDNGKRKLDEEETNAANYLSSSNAKRKPDDCKFLSTKTNGVVDAMAVRENANSVDGIPSKRNLRRLSNCKESVLQNAIALKEKSFGIRDISCYKKSKPSKSLTRQVRIQSPKTADVSSEKKNPSVESSNNESSLSACVSNFVDTSSVSNMSESCEISKSSVKYQPEMNAISYSCENYSMSSGDLSYGNGFRPIRKKKRYFKGLSYSFGRKKNSKRRRAGPFHLSHGKKPTNLQSTTNISMETNGFTSTFLLIFTVYK